MDRNDPQPCPYFTPEELRYLQDLLDEERAGWFNFYMKTLEDDRVESFKEEAHNNYVISKSLRNKVYHMNHRDTLAPGPETHRQRYWDQGHHF